MFVIFVIHSFVVVKMNSEDTEIPYDLEMSLHPWCIAYDLFYQKLSFLLRLSSNDEPSTNESINRFIELFHIDEFCVLVEQIEMTCRFIVARCPLNMKEHSKQNFELKSVLLKIYEKILVQLLNFILECIKYHRHCTTNPSGVNMTFDDDKVASIIGILSIEFLFLYDVYKTWICYLCYIKFNYHYEAVKNLRPRGRNLFKNQYVTTLEVIYFIVYKQFILTEDLSTYIEKRKDILQRTLHVKTDEEVKNEFRRVYISKECHITITKEDDEVNFEKNLKEQQSIILDHIKSFQLFISVQRAQVFEIIIKNSLRTMFKLYERHHKPISEQVQTNETKDENINEESESYQLWSSDDNSSDEEEDEILAEEDEMIDTDEEDDILGYVNNVLC